MNKYFMAAAGTATLMALTSGCYYTHITTPAATPEMQEWEKVIMESYPGYTPPKATNTNFRGKADTRVSVAPRSAAPAPMDADVPVTNTEVQDIPAENEAPAVQDIPTEPQEPAVTEVKAEAPAPEAEPAVTEVKAEAPAPEAKAEEKKVETPAAEVKAEEKKVETPAAEVKAEDKKANNPPDPTNSIVYEVKYGDTLGSISQKIYGSARFSNVIFKANSDILKNPNILRPGMKLIVPKL